MEKENTTHPGVYLKHAHLKGYRTIRDLEVDFEPGLNIIIGKNGSGKTNLVEFLYKALFIDYSEVSSVYSTLLHINTKENKIFSIKASSEHAKSLQEELFNEPKPSFYLNNKALDYDTFNYKIPFPEKGEYDVYFINYGTPQNYSLVSEPFSFNVRSYDNKTTHVEPRFGDSNLFFKKKTSYKLSAKLFSVIREEDENYEVISKVYSFLQKNYLQNIINFDYINNQLNKFSPIEQIRLSKNYNLFLNTKEEKISLDNLFLEFRINNSWLPFSQLSDGTKRIFYIISEVAGLFYETEHENKEIIFLEEPELGIHPHQLFLLMQFLKEQAKEKQIILTTHSPKVLDILDIHELDRIKITEMTEKGTQVRGLNAEEKRKAEIYMEDEGFLSDYWLYSDLEEEED